MVNYFNYDSVSLNFLGMKNISDKFVEKINT